MLCYAIVTSVSWFEEAKYILEKRLLGLLSSLSEWDREIQHISVHLSVHCRRSTRTSVGIPVFYFTWPLIGKCLDLTFLFSPLAQKILAQDSRRLKGQCPENCFQTESVGS